MNNDKIRQLNDEFRASITTPNILGKLVITQGVNAQPRATVMQLVLMVSEFDDFTPDNDPYEEHDFGIIEHEGNSYNWKIDYYAPNLLHGSENPADEDVTQRVLTLMLPSEN